MQTKEKSLFSVAAAIPMRNDALSVGGEVIRGEEGVLSL